MKKILAMIAVVVLLFSCAYAGEMDLPYEQFVQVYDGDQIDFNDDGIPERISYSAVDEGRHCTYTIQVGDSRPVSGEIGTRYQRVTDEDDDKLALLYAVRMYGGDFLFVYGELDSDIVAYDVYQIVETDYDTLYEAEYENKEILVANTYTTIFSEPDEESDGIGKMKNGEFLLCDDSSGTFDYSGEWYKVTYYGMRGYVKMKDADITMSDGFFGEWTVRYVDTLECYGYPEDFHVTDACCVSNYDSAVGLGSPQYRRTDFYLYCKDWAGVNWDLDNTFIGRIFELEHGCYATWPEVYAIVAQEVPLYTSRTSNEIGDVLQPGDAVASVMADGTGKIYLQQIKSNRYDWDVKSGWIEIDDRYNLILNGQQIEDGYYCSVQQYFDGLHFGG